MIKPHHDPDEDDLANDAQAYEDSLQSGSQETTPFEAGHPGLAKTLRMLREVFRPESNAPQQHQEQAIQFSQIGRFQVERLLGNGNFGSVWLAHDPLLKRDVAVKVAHVGLHARADLQERFEREAVLAARLYHPNIVPVFETGVDNGRLFIVSECCIGPSLAEWLAERDERVDPRVAADWIRQLADAADHAHHQGLVHRDIKPGNVLLTSPSDNNDGEAALTPRLTDFGLARDLTSETSSTRSGALLGTLEYMSPEQATGNVAAQGPSSDIFSLGVVLYQLLAGERPFKGQSDFEIIQRIARAEPAAPHRLHSAVPRDLSSICMKCLEKQPARRYASAAELRDDLDRFFRDEPTFARPIANVERVVRWARRAPAVAALAAVSLASLLAIIAGLAFYLRVAERHAQDLTVALETAREEKETARRARLEAEEQRRAARETSYLSDMRLAFELWERGRIQQTASALARQVPDGDVDLRGHEWFVLDAALRARYRELGRHAGAATECVVSRDQRSVFTTGTDGVVRIWDLQTGAEVAAFDPQIGELHALAVSPDESTIAVGGKPWVDDLARVALIDRPTGKQLRSLQTHETTIEAISFSPDGKWLAAGSRYEPIQLTRLSDDASFVIPSMRRNRAIAFSSDSRFLLAPANENHFVVWRVDGPEPVEMHELTGTAARDPYVATCAPGLPLAAVAHQNLDFVCLYDPAVPILRDVASSVSEHNPRATISCLAFSPDAEVLAAGDASGVIQLWRPGTRKIVDTDRRWSASDAQIAPLIAFRPHEARVTAIAVTKDARSISSGEDGRVVVTAPFAQGLIHVRWENLQVNNALLVGDTLLQACEDGAVRQYAIDADQLQTPSRAGGAGIVILESNLPEVIFRLSSPVCHLAISPDGELIAAGTRYGGVSLHRRSTGELVRRLVDDQPGAVDCEVGALVFSSHGRLLAHTGAYGTVGVLDTTTGEEMLSYTTGSRGYALAFFNDDRWLACGGQFENVRVLDISSGNLVRSIPSGNTYSISKRSDGNRLASTHADGTLQIFDAALERAPRVILGHFGFGESCPFTPDGRTLTTVGSDGVVQFTDVASGDVFGRLDLQYGAKMSHHFNDAAAHCTEKLLAVTTWKDKGGSDLYLWKLDRLPQHTNDGGVASAWNIEASQAVFVSSRPHLGEW